jgi:E3 ubiquitin-protein ligase RNF144
MAEDLQLQEVLQFSTQSERVCDVCKKVFPSSEGFWQPENCHHAICIACFCQFAPEPEATGLPRCVVASCESSRMSEEQQGKDAFHDTFTSFEDLDGRKGKEPCDGMFQELGQCSCGASSDFYCTICMESVHVREFFPIAGCTHTFCELCRPVHRCESGGECVVHWLPRPWVQGWHAAPGGVLRCDPVSGVPEVGCCAP